VPVSYSKKQQHIDSGLAAIALLALSSAVAMQRWQWHWLTCDWNNFLKSNNQIPERATAQFYA